MLLTNKLNKIINEQLVHYLTFYITLMEQNMIEKFKKHESLIRIITTSISLVALIISLILNLQKNSLSIDLAWIAIILCGTPIIVGTLIGVIKDHDIKLMF